MSERSRRWTVLEVLGWTREHFEEKGISTPRLDAEVLLSHVLGMPRVMLYAHFDQPLGQAERDRMRELVMLRSRGAPVAHLLGTKEFWSLELDVTPAVLVPRPETEVLVEVARRRGRSARRVVDVGTGSGAVALALAHELPEARVWGLEVSEDALQVARRNVDRHRLSHRVEVLLSDLLDRLPDGARPVDLLVGNLPYIPTADLAGLPVDVRAYEPRLALDGGPDGLDLMRRLLAGAPSHLAPGAIIGLESGPEQVEPLRDLLELSGFRDIEIERDLAGLGRVTSGRWSP